MMKKVFLTLCILTLVWIDGSAQKNKKTELNIASFNVRMDTENDGLDAWKYRKEMVKSLIVYHDFDVFGTQEGFKHQLDEIAELKDYAYVGVGRDDGKDGGEHSAIFYKKNRFRVMAKGDFWLAENPDLPGKGWDATCCNRICSWVKLEDLRAKKSFFVFNVHYDHEGRIARRNSSILLLEKIRQIGGESPVFCTGDFNATPDDEPIRTIYEDGFLRDSYSITMQSPYGTEGTFNSFDMKSPMNSRIDYIWVSPQVSVNKYAVLNEQQYGHFPSDHFPVLIRAVF